MHILLVEDDPAIAAPLAEILEYEGFRVTAVSTGAAALEHAARTDAVLLDLGLPDMDGMEVCRRLRSNPATATVPILVVTARGEEFQRVLGLELGADDYIVKPFSFRELVARLRAVMRRTTATPDAETERGSPASVIGALRIDRRTRRVNMGDHEISLTAKEFDVLAYLAEEPGAVRTRQDILEAVWDSNWYGPTKTVDAHVAAVRRKLGDGDWIAAVRGVGFRLEEPRS